MRNNGAKEKMGSTMSAKNRGTEADELCRYYTPKRFAVAGAHWLRDNIEWTLGDERQLRVVEPAAGGGAWCDAIGDVMDARVVAVDCDPHAAALIAPGPAVVQTIEADWLTVTTDRVVFGAPDLIVGNPPFAMRSAPEIAEQFVVHATKMLGPRGGVVAMLQRLNWLAGKGRSERFWKRRVTPIVGVFPERPSFTGDGKTDAADYCMYVWVIGSGSQIPMARWIGSPLSWIEMDVKSVGGSNV